MKHPPIYPLIDIGVNLTHKSFSADREKILADAQAQGVQTCIITGLDLRSSELAAEYARAKPGGLYCTAGFHPHNAKSFTREAESVLRRLYALPQVLAVGECGLDFDRNFSPPALQEACFETHLGMAEETGKPLFLHERKAHKRFTEMLAAHKGMGNKAVVHCFTGNKNELRTYLDLGCYIGITGWICDERRGQDLREAVQYVPPDRLMLETDSPFLTPRNMRPLPSRNEPAYLPYVLQGVAEALHQPAAEIAPVIFKTTQSFFGLS